ncbi:MAG: ABC-type transport auxiliary lipoprotein family protein [Alphaproteobacteria bacterium]
MTHFNNIFVVTRVAYCLIAVALYGCSLGPAETTPVRTYLLEPSFFAKTIPANPARGDRATLLVSVPRAQPGFETPRMAYLLRPHELNYYAFNQWVDTPGRMMLKLLVESMERSGLWRAVVQAPSPVRAEYRLDCDSLVLQQQFFSPSRVRLGLRAQLIDVRRQTVIGARNFEAFAASPSEDAYGGVVAANEASARLLEELTVWVATVMDEDSPAGD